MKIFLLIAFVLTAFTVSFAQSEQAPIQEKDFDYQDWTYKSINEDKTINLRDFAKDKKLVLVVYFAPWCPNWKHEAPFVQKMYEKYKSNGLAVIGVGEYDTVEAMKTGINFFKITFPVVFESDSKDTKEKTMHFGYRKKTGDTRNWGSPWNIFLEPGKLKEKGDTISKKSYIANGELIEIEAEKFIREKLGLGAGQLQAANENKTAEVCDELTEFKKPN